MKLQGKVTRVIEKDENRGIKSRVFFLPDDPAAALKLDGSKQTGSGEIAIAVDNLEDYKVGDEVEFEV